MGVRLTKFLYYLFQKGIYSVAVLASILTIFNIYDVKNNASNEVEENDIQSFVIRTLDNSLYFESSNDQYCEFLDMYSDSFTVTSEVNEDEVMVDEYTALLEFTDVSGEDYSVYIQLSEPVDEISHIKVFEMIERVSPTLMEVNSISKSNIYLYSYNLSEQLQKIIVNFKNFSEN